MSTALSLCYYSSVRQQCTGTADVCVRLLRLCKMHCGLCATISKMLELKLAMSAIN